MKNKKGFTLIEILMIVAIIGILVSIVIVSWAISSQRKATIASYKTAMNSVQAAAEMCRGSSGNIKTGSQGDQICDYDGDDIVDSIERYPKLSPKCGDITFGGIDLSGDDWNITTSGPCQNCRIICDVRGCREFEGECD